MFNLLSDFFRILTNLTYLTPFWVWRFESRNPSENVIVAGATKARKVQGENNKVRYEAGWIVSRRGIAMLTETKITCAGWDIPLSSIKKATLLRFRQLATRAYVLKVSTETENYQFGLMHDERWENQDVLKLEIEDSKIEYSTFSIILRVVAVAFLIWYVSQRFF